MLSQAPNILTVQWTFRPSRNNSDVSSGREGAAGQRQTVMGCGPSYLDSSPLGLALPKHRPLQLQLC